MRCSIEKLALWAMLFFILWVYGARAVWLTTQYGLTDFFRFYQSVLFYFSGQSIYSPSIVQSASLVIKTSGDLNPPFFTLLFLPFVFLSYAQAFFVWTVFSVGLVVLGTWLVLRPFVAWRKYFLRIFVLLLLYYPNQSNFDWGQLGPLLLCLLALGWLFTRENKDVLAGMVIGLACSIKLFCGLFFVYFWCIKRWRLFSVMLLTVVTTFLIGGILFGFNSYLAYISVLNHVGWVAWTGNAALMGFIQRIKPLLHSSLFARVGKELGIVLAVTYLMLWWRKWGSDIDLGYSLVLVSMLFLSPLGWLYYFPVLIIPYLVLVAQRNDTVHMIALFLLGLSTLMTHNFEPKTPWQILWTGGLGFYALLGMMILLRRRYAAHQWMPPYGWPVMYAVVFTPSLFALWTTFKGFS